ncbi:MAG: metalloregulator ArsR/SmtB family transcription factor [Phycisphaeraceae bacterium]
MVKDLDIVFKALADTTRREILDLLRQGPRRTTQIVEAFPKLSRFGVMKHLSVLKEANLVTTRSEGREVFNSLNVVPLRQVYVRWVRKYEDLWAMNLLKVKDDAEKGEM